MGHFRQQSELDVTEFLSKVEDVRKKVVATGDVIKRLVDRQIHDVLTELQSVMTDKQAESVREAYELALVKVKEFSRDSRQLLDKDRPNDITRAACELHDRATELLNTVTAVQYHPPDMTFIPADVTQVKRRNLIGNITITTDEQPGTSHLLHSYHLSFYVV